MLLFVMPIGVDVTKSIIVFPGQPTCTMTYSVIFCPTSTPIQATRTNIYNDLNVSCCSPRFGRTPSGRITVLIRVIKFQAPLLSTTRLALKSVQAVRVLGADQPPQVPLQQLQELASPMRPWAIIVVVVHGAAPRRHDYRCRT